MKKLLIIAILLFIAFDIWIFITVFEPGLLRFSLDKSFNTREEMVKNYPIDHSIIHTTGNIQEFYPPMVKVSGVIKNVTFQGNRLQIDIELRKGLRTALLSTFAVDTIVVTHAPKGIIPPNQTWTGESVSNLKNSLSLNEPIIVELPYVTTQDIARLQKTACPTDVCRGYLRLIESTQNINKQVIDEWEKNSTITTQGVVGPLQSAILYD